MLKDLQEQIQKYASENASTLLTAGGVVGTVATAVLTGAASFKAAEIIRDIEEQAIEDAGEAKHDTMGLSKAERVRVAWPLFVAPTVVGGATIASIVAANRVSAKQAAALAAAYGMSQQRLEEYKAKVAEKLTGPKRQAIDDEIAQDRVTSNPPNNEVIILAGGDVLCYDMITGRYFRSTVEQIHKAVNKINADLAQRQYASLSDFYDEVGLPSTEYTETVGWGLHNQDLPVEVKLSTTMTPDQKPCVTIDFNILPTPEFDRVV